MTPAKQIEEALHTAANEVVWLEKAEPEKLKQALASIRALQEQVDVERLNEGIYRFKRRNSVDMGGRNCRPLDEAAVLQAAQALADFIGGGEK